MAEVEAIVQDHHTRGQRLRIVGSGLSPNGVGLSDDGGCAINLASMDKILSVDKEKAQVTVEGGIKVGDLCEMLRRDHGLTLPNLASIAEQQVGGFIQVGAHGSGAAIGPVDTQVVALTMVTPGLGTVKLSAERHPELFHLARVGLGLLGVCVHVTLQCVPAHDLLEHTYTVTRRWARDHHARLLRQHKHVRFMWVPFTDTVVVVTNDDVPPELRTGYKRPAAAKKGHSMSLMEAYDEAKLPAPAFSPAEAVAPMRTLLERVIDEGKVIGVTAAECAGMGMATLRDHLLAADPLNTAWVKTVNSAEAQCWKRSEGFRIGRNVDLLQFDCGGQQWVSEVCMPAGTLDHPTGSELKFMDEVLALIEAHDIPAPSPIEQRWSGNSSSVMSPAHATAAQRGRLLAGLDLQDTLHSWVGIIMYLPTSDPKVRDAITKAFMGYRRRCAAAIWPLHDAAEHWAKVELPWTSRDGTEAGEAAYARELAVLRARLAGRFPLEALEAGRQRLDPKRILTSDRMDAMLPPRHSK